MRDDAHDLMPEHIADQLPPIGATEHVKPDQKVVLLKVFDPCSRWTWYAVEFDGEDTCFGYIVSGLGSDCDEWGYFSLAELKSVRNRLGIPLERDLHWKAGPVPR